MLKKSTLLFLSVFLLLAFSVSPVEAQDQCLPCGSCDRDGDGEIRPTRNCIRKCGGMIDDDDSQFQWCLRSVFKGMRLLTARS